MFYYLACPLLLMNVLNAMNERSWQVALLHQPFQGCRTYTNFEKLTQLEKATLEGDVIMCKQLLNLGANPALEDYCGHNALYMAAIEKKSLPLCLAILTTCPSIKPTLKTMLLIFKRYGYTLPKDILLHLIAPYIINYEAQKKLNSTGELLAKKYVHLVNMPPYISGPHIIPQFKEQEDLLHTIVENRELKKLLDPNQENLTQLKETIIKELYASIGMTLIK